jgi:hypothetical protein
VKGPSVTTSFPPRIATRNDWALGASPPPERKTPFFSYSAVYVSIAANISGGTWSIGISGPLTNVR